MFLEAYKNKHVLVTGNTGFKGSWLSLWLQKLNAEVYGYSLKSPTNPNHFDLLNLNMRTEYGDIRNYKKLASYITEIKPEVVFHLAAQSLVRKSYFNPRQTYETNVMGTLNLLEACKKIGSVNVFINVTSDKCYENTEQIWGYREIDRLGGYDPPKHLFDLLRDICQKGNFNSMAMDIFETIDGQFYINELQSMFGSYNNSQMYINGKPGRYTYKEGQYIFEEGYFNIFGSCLLRVEHFISILKKNIGI